MSQEATNTQKGVTRHLVGMAVAVALLFGGVGLLAARTELSGAVIANGSMVVESNVKKVQHPSGGIVADLLVTDGTKVGAGDLLIRLDETTAQSNLSSVSKDLWELTARRARLEAERDGTNTVDFPQDLIDARSDPHIERIIVGEKRLFELHGEAQAGQKAQYRERIAQLRDEIGGLTEQTTAKVEEIALIEKELGGVRQLFEKSLVPLSRMTALQREAARLRGERGQLVASIAQSKGKISETELQIIQVDQNMRSDVGKELADIRAKMSELTEKKITAQDQLQRLEIRAPQAGIVHQLSVHTKGGVIATGEQIMLIVPGTELIAEVHVAPQDIDQLNLGQDVTLRFPNFNQRTTPELNGVVSRIAADTVQDQRTGNSYFPVRISLNEDEIGRLEGAKLIPGMPVEAFIRTTDRNILSYFLKPLADQARRAFREK